MVLQNKGTVSLNFFFKPWQTEHCCFNFSLLLALYVSKKLKVPWTSPFSTLNLLEKKILSSYDLKYHPCDDGWGWSTSFFK